MDTTQSSAPAVSHDLGRMVQAAVDHDIPALIGSAGTAGGRVHVNMTEEILLQEARKRGLSFPYAKINTELDPQSIAMAFRRGELRPLDNAPEISEESIMSCTRIVAMAGPEPFEAALRQGAQVVIAGRSSDTSLYVAVPHMKGIPYGPAYHAAKTLECGAACARERKYPDSMAAILDEDGFTVEPPNPEFVCTPQSVASHTLYENADPFLLVEPGGTLDTTNAAYSAVSDRAVRVTNSKFTPAPQYTVRLEAARLAGYRTTVIAGIRDPLVLQQLGAFVDSASDRIYSKIADSLNVDAGQYRMRWIVYGGSGVMGSLEPSPAIEGHEVGVVIDIVAPTQQLASAIGSIAWHTALHHPIKEYSGLVSNLAFPMSPPAMDAGPVYEFAINHVWAIDDPLSMCEIELLSA